MHVFQPTWKEMYVSLGLRRFTVSQIYVISRAKEITDMDLDMYGDTINAPGSILLMWWCHVWHVQSINAIHTYTLHKPLLVLVELHQLWEAAMVFAPIESSHWDLQSYIRRRVVMKMDRDLSIDTYILTRSNTYSRIPPYTCRSTCTYLYVHVFDSRESDNPNTSVLHVILYFAIP